MNCSQCGAAAPAGAAFCSQCGSKLESGKGAAAAEIPDAAERLRPAAAREGGRNAPEEDLWSGTYSPKAMAQPFVWATLLVIIGAVVASFAGPPGWIAVGIGALLIFGYLGFLLLYRQWSVRYRLTTQRLLRETGILSRRNDRNLVVEIDDVAIRQGFVDRMLDVGTVVLNTSDDTTPVLEMKGIESPRQLADLIDDARRKERDRRFLYTTNA